MGQCGDPQTVYSGNVLRTRIPAVAPPPPVPPVDGATDTLRWQLEVPMATCRFILYDTMKVLGISAVLLMVFGAIVALFAGGYDAPLATWLMGLRIILLVFGGMGAALLLIMLTFFGNRFPVRYTLSSFGLRWEALSRRGHWANRVAFVAGLMTGRLAVAGAGALAASRGVEEFRWSDIRRVRFHPREGVISLMNGWRVVMRLHCPPTMYEYISCFVLANATNAQLEGDLR